MIPARVTETALWPTVELVDTQDGGSPSRRALRDRVRLLAALVFGGEAEAAPDWAERVYELPGMAVTA